jgi:CMP-N-acetylneuraminic acid synthetase
MIDRASTRIVALVPMLHASQRVPGKNFRPFAGRPLYHHIMTTLLSCPSVQEVVIDTDSPTIREDAARTFPTVRLLERAGHLRAGTVPMNDVLVDDVRRVEADVYLQTHSTNPLLTAGTVERAIEAFFDGADHHDSLFSVTPRRARFWTTSGAPVNHDPSRLLRTQDVSPLLEENSCLYIFRGADLLRRGNRIGERPLLFEIEAAEAWDIDEEIDFRVAEFLFQSQRGGGDR